MYSPRSQSHALPQNPSAGGFPLPPIANPSGGLPAPGPTGAVALPESPTVREAGPLHALTVRAAPNSPLLEWHMYMVIGKHIP